MQSIERYGVVALLFLVVTVIAVLVWDGDTPLPGAERVAQAAAKSTAPDVVPNTKANDGPRRVKLKSPPIRAEQKPLSRELAAERKLEEEARERQAERASNSDFGVRELGGRASGAAGIVAGDGTTLASPPKKNTRRPNPRRTIGGDDSDEESAQSAAERKTVEPTRSTRGRTYTIQSGDTLSEIAMQELGTMSRWPEIVELNDGLDPGKLAVGQMIRLPLTKEGDVVAARTKRETSSETRKADGATYEVESGDSLWRIAQAMLGDGGRWAEIAKLNPSIDADRLRPGQELVLPTGAKPAPSVATQARTLVAAETTSNEKRRRVR